MRGKNNHLYGRVVWMCLVLCLGVAPLGYGQSNHAGQLHQQVSQYSQQNLQEKLYLHTDKTFYLAGETIWFKVYQVEGSRHTPLSLSQVAYVEILNQEQVPVVQTKIATNNGKGAGALALPQSLPSGNFLIRAYTSWMKNTGAAFFFQQPVTIVNTTQPLGLGPEDLSVAYEVQFFPEGGHLVNGLTSKVAFKATDKNGKGVSFTGAVVNQKNDTVARFYTHKFGIGTFTFTPEAGHAYRAILKGDNQEVITRALPAAQETGMVMRVTETDQDQIRVEVTYSPVGASPTVYLLAHTRQEAIASLATAVDAQGNASFLLRKSELGDGISHFTVFNAARQPVCERLFFQAPRQPLRLAVSSNQRQYGPRALVNLSLHAQNAQNQPEAADVSVAVFRLDSLGQFPQQMIESYLWLSSDLRGAVESPDYYFSNTGPEVTIAQDNLMLTHGWRRFSWQKVLQTSPSVPAFLPELGGHLIYGRMTNRHTGAPVPFEQAFLASPSLRVQLSTARGNQNGVMVFDLKDLYGTRDLVLQTSHHQDSTLRLEINTPFSSDTAAYVLPFFDLAQQVKSRLEASMLHLQVQHHHHPPKEILPVGKTDTSTFFGKPSKRYFLDSYTRFPTLEDVLREYVALVTVREKKGKFNFMVADLTRKVQLEEEPLVLVDGVPAFDLDHLMTYDPKKIRKVEVLGQRYIHGGLAYGGIISFTTYKGKFENLEVDPKALLVEYEGLQHTREFYHPTYETPEQRTSRLPDLRNVLYWNPSVTLDASGKQQLRFYTSDQAGKYLVVVQGLSAGGKAGSTTFMFEVKPAS